MAFIDTHSVESKTGYKKKLDAKAEQVILNIVQINLYTYPFKSMVRELCSNCLDSLREKRMAVNILSGNKQISDYFVIREGDLYEDSQFDPTYYKPEFFDPAHAVELQYINNHTETRDLFVIKDSGVGLGNRRLEKFFTPGYSSKRLNVDVLGSYGLGSKSPLATLVDSYRVISTYEGRRFAFDVYVDKVDSIISKFGIDGSINNYIEFDTLDNKGDRMLVYYEKTSGYNGVEIQVEVKRHNKDQIIEAIKSQLMYFKEDIKAYDVHGSSRSEINFKSNILFENDDIILSDNHYFSKPHFVLKGVNYGLIDFRELDLDARMGNLGIKVDMSNVDVSPSRESITYTPKTRETVLNKYKKVTDEVTKMINDKLDAKSFLEWINNANSIYFSNDMVVQDKVINTLSKLIDKSTLDLEFKSVDGFKVKFASDLKEFFTPFIKVEQLDLEKFYSNGAWQGKVKRNGVTNVSSIHRTHIYFQFVDTINSVNQYLIKEVSNRITLIRPNFFDEDSNEAVSHYVNKTSKAMDKPSLFNFLVSQIDIAHPDLGKENKTSTVRKALISNCVKALNIIDLLMAEKDIKNIKNVVVPENFEFKEEDYTNDDLEEIKKVDKGRYKKLLEKRKLEEKFVAKTIKDVGSYNNNYRMTTLEIKKTDIPTSEIYYCTSEMEDEMLKLGSFLDQYNKKRSTVYVDGTTHYDNSCHLVCYNDTVALLMVAKNNIKYVQEERSLEDFGLLYTSDEKLTSYDFVKRGLLSNYITTLLASKSIFLDNIDHNMLNTLYPRVAKIVKFVHSNKGIAPKSIDYLKIEGLSKIQKAFNAQIKLYLNPDLDEVEVDNILVDALDIDITDSIKGLDLIDFTIFDDIKYMIDYLSVFGKYIRDEIRTNTDYMRLFNFYYDKNKSLLTLEHEDII